MNKWEPKNGDTYYLISEEGIPLHAVWADTTRDILRRLFGNMFQTLADATAAAAFTKAALHGKELKKLKELREENMSLKQQLIDITGGERALILALRKSGIARIFDEESSYLVSSNTPIHGVVAFNVSNADNNAFERRRKIREALNTIKIERETLND